MPTVGTGANFAESFGLRWLDSFSGEIAQSIKRLATGKRINSAADDPAGSIAVEHFNADEATLIRQIDSKQLEARRLSALDGGLSAVSDLLTQLQSDVVTAANRDGATDQERKAAQTDADSIVGVLDFLSQTTTFGGEQILKGYVNASLGEQYVPSSDPAHPEQADVLGLHSLRTGGRLNLINGDAETAQKVVQSAVDTIADQRGTIGARSQQLDHELSLLEVQRENIAGARSAIQDTDYAAEVSRLIRAQVLRQAAVYAVTAARNISAQSVLALLG